MQRGTLQAAGESSSSCSASVAYGCVRSWSLCSLQTGQVVAIKKIRIADQKEVCVRVRAPEIC